MKLDAFVSGRPGRTIAGALCATQILLHAPALARAQGGAVAARAETRRENGLFTTTFTTPRGRIAILLPDDIAPGDTVSATMNVVGENKQSAPQQQQSRDSLLRYQVTLGETSAPVEQGRIVVAAPATPLTETLSLVLSDENGNRIGRADIRLTTARTRLPATADEVFLPRSGKAGQPLVVPGRFDGDLTNTRVLIGGVEAPVLAESPRKVVVQSPSDPKGKTRIEVREGDRTATAEFNNEGRRRNDTGKVLGAVVVIGIIVGIWAIRTLDGGPF